MKPARLVLLADTLLELYRRMLRIRRAEERLVKSYQEGLIAGHYSSAMGHEAIAVGVCYHLSVDDVVFASACGQAQAIAKGLDLQALFAELYGRATGCAGGRAGITFLNDLDKGLWGSSGVPGASIVQAVGAAMAFALLKKPSVAVGFFSEEAVSSGAFHEGLNLAAQWNLPVILVCEHGVGATHAGPAFPHVAAYAKAYDVPGYEVEGHDVAMVYSAAFEATRRARQGKGPSLLECSVHRMRPLTENGLHTGRWSAWPAVAAECDPVAALASKLKELDAAVGAELAAIDEQIRREVEAAHQAARNAPWPTSLEESDAS